MTQTQHKTKQPRILWITPEAKRKLDLYIQECDFEISGLGTIEVLPDNEGVLITDVAIFEQEGTHGETTLDVEGRNQFMLDLLEADEGANLEAWKLWWHSHVDGGTFWSGTDTDTAENKNRNSSFSVSVVGNRRGEYLGRIDIFTPVQTVVDDLELNVYDPVSEAERKAVQKEIKEKVREKRYGGFQGGGGGYYGYQGGQRTFFTNNGQPAAIIGGHPADDDDADYTHWYGGLKDQVGADTDRGGYEGRVIIGGEKPKGVVEVHTNQRPPIPGFVKYSDGVWRDPKQYQQDKENTKNGKDKVTTVDTDRGPRFTKYDSNGRLLEATGHNQSEPDTTNNPNRRGGNRKSDGPGVGEDGDTEVIIGGPGRD